MPMAGQRRMSALYYIGILLNVLPWIGVHCSKPQHLRGIRPADVTFYTSSSTFQCRDGSRNLDASRVNDDFCDCLDGSDEPGTSACPNGSFYCRNRGHIPVVIFSSRVNDGICDCCDGSDEYEDRIKCPNSCIEAGAAARKHLAEEVAKYREGVKLRMAAIEDWGKKRKKWLKEKEAAEAKKVTLEELEKELKGKKEAIEAKEREEREWKEKLAKEQEARDKVEQEGRPAPPPPTPAPEPSSDAAAGSEAQSEAAEGTAAPSAHEGAAAGTEAEPAAEGSGQASEGGSEGSAGEEEDDEMAHLSKEEIGRRIAERWTGHHEEQQEGHSSSSGQEEGAGRGQEAADDANNEGDAAGDSADYSVDEGQDYVSEEEEAMLREAEGEDYDDLDEEERAMLEEERQQGRQETEEDKRAAEAAQDDAPVEEEDDEDLADDDEDFDRTDPPGAATPITTWFARVLNWPRDFCSSVYSLIAKPPPLNLNHTEAAEVKAEYGRVSSELGKLRTRIRQLTGKLGHDYGPNHEFVSLVDRCFSFHVNQYEYEICPWKRVTQKEGHSETTVGRWKGFDKEHRELKFEDGDHCWNGPNRSMKVVLSCGVEQKVLTVDEPNRCEYVATMSTPALCTEERARELEAELREREAELVHDEL